MKPGVSWRRPLLRRSGNLNTRPRRLLPVVLLLPELLLIIAPVTAADNQRLECKPRAFDVVPGEPMRLELTVLAESAEPIRLHVPRHPLLKLRALEKLPVQRTRDGIIVHKRGLVWQALEPGMVKIETLFIETKEKKLFFPEIIITVRDPGP